MILMAARAISIFLPLTLMAGIWIALRRKTTVGARMRLSALTVLFVLIAYTVSSHISPVRDEVTITALDERNEASLASEIRLLGYEIDGKEYLATDDLDLRNGKWSWAEGGYCWRPEADLRQPEGTTRSITIGVPVGRDRELYFRADEYGGIVLVEFPSAGGGVS